VESACNQGVSMMARKQHKTYQPDHVSFAASGLRKTSLASRSSTGTSAGANTAPKTDSSWWHLRSFLISVAVGGFVVIITMSLLANPLLIRWPWPRFAVYSTTMMLPTLLVSSVGFPFHINFSMTAYYLVTFFSYFLICYFLLRYHALIARPDRRRRFVIFAWGIYALLMIISIMFLAHGYYG
jgi:hypothetical protein